ncbi:hypothetical protein V5O48_015092 [Marasmius crinis-equi]|uniref:Uncharacterized protein n=1 Tax=Marasmius crinis-equi TaxID=585013 RepID=A0ABR3EVG7_9AGAR
MGPGSRTVVLNDHFGFYNWCKYVGMGASLARQYTNTVKDRNQQVKAHWGLTASLPSELRDRWEKVCVTWEEGKLKEKGLVDPFLWKKSHTYFIRLAWMYMELIWGLWQISHSGRPRESWLTGAFISLGLELEEAQRKLTQAVKEASTPTRTQAKSLAERRRVLTRKILSWIPIRHVYIPGLQRVLEELREAIPDPSDIHPEQFPLWLPSTIPSSKRSSACVEGLVEIETRLREVQCCDCLDTIRHTLRLKTRMLEFKYANVTGQREGVRSRTMINKIHDRVKRGVETYRASWSALMKLRGLGSWEGELKDLKDSDVRGYVDPERMKRDPGHRRTAEDMVDDSEVAPETVPPPSDINLIPEDRQRAIDRLDGTDIDNKILCEVWAKSRAQAQHTKEAVRLAVEEMRRTLETLSYKSKEWEWRAMIWTVDPVLQEGLAAYAKKQQQLYARLKQAWSVQWSKPLVEMETTSAVEPETVADGNDEVLDEEEEEEGEDELEEDSEEGDTPVH